MNSLVKNLRSVVFPHIFLISTLTLYKITPEKVYQTDYRKIIESSLLVAYVGEPSLGVGQEIQIASFNQVPILLVFERDAKVSRMTLGTPMVKQTFQFENIENLREWVRQFMIWYAKP